MAGSVAEFDSNDTKHKLQLHSKTVFTSLPEMRPEVETNLANLRARTKADVEALINGRLTQWTNTLHLPIVNAFKSTSEDIFRCSSYNSNDGLCAAMFEVFENVLAKWSHLVFHWRAKCEAPSCPIL